jgi:hypothetical protein
MSKNQNNLAALALLAHNALNGGDTEYARNKALIAQFFRPSCAVEHKEEVRLTLIDSLYSTNVSSRRLFGISDIAQSLRGAFPGGDKEIKAQAALWIKNGFDNENPLYPLFAANYGVNKGGGGGEAAYSLLSKYLYFATGYAFPIYDALGKKYFSIAQRKARRTGKKGQPDFQKRFRVLKAIMDDTGIGGFDQLDNLFWLYGKVKESSLSPVLNKARYAELTKYRGKRSIESVVKEIRTANNAAKPRKIFGADMYMFIKQTAALGRD